MPAPVIHPLALVEPGAVLGDGVEVNAFARVFAGAVIGAGCKIASHAIVEGCVVLEDNVEVDHFAVIGGAPQDMGFDTTVKTGVRIGARTRLREGVTVHRATKPGTDTIIGPDCMLMANSHVAHDSELEHHVILANGALVAGHVKVGIGAFISGNVCVHQFCRVGTFSMVAAGCVITEDMPPYCVAAERNRVAGLNVVGLRRQGIPGASVADIRACYRRVYLGDSMNLTENAIAAREEGLGATPEGATFLDFFIEGGKRKRICRPDRRGGGE